MAENSRRKTWIFLALAAGVVVVVLLVLAGRPHGPFVPVVSTSRQDLRASITSNGKVEPISPTVARAEFPTFVQSVKATEGQSVHKGQVILTLDDSEMRAQLAQARSNLLSAQSDLRNARAGGPPDQVAQIKGDLEKARVQVASLERSQKALEQLVTKQAATQEEVAQNRASLAQARANLQTLQERKSELVRSSSVDAQRASLRVNQIQDQVRALDEKVKSATVIAPSDGTLYSLPVKQGDYVKVGDVLAEMADLHHVRVRAFVDEPDLGWLEPDQTVEITWDAKPGITWTGQTEQVPKQVVARGTRSVGEVLCSVRNDKLDLLPNINVSVRILVRDRPDALVVPRAAVHYENGQHYVFVYEGSKIRRRDITVGVASAVKYEVLSGLKDGDRIALPANDVELRDGMDVRPEAP